VAAIQQDMSGFANHVTPTETVAVVPDDPNDDHVVACAAGARSDYLISGDKHLLKLGSFRGTRIIKVADFLPWGEGDGASSVPFREAVGVPTATGVTYVDLIRGYSVPSMPGRPGRPSDLGHVRLSWFCGWVSFRKAGRLVT
jgi:hypothetical protein